VKTTKVFETFVGSYVSVAVKNMRANSKGKIANLLLMGYLLDECETFFYLGETDKEVTVAVARTDVVAMMSAAEVAELDFPMDTEGELQ
jgi:hypothetical protein